MWMEEDCHVFAPPRRGNSTLDPNETPDGVSFEGFLGGFFCLYISSRRPRLPDRYHGEASDIIGEGIRLFINRLVKDELTTVFPVSYGCYPRAGKTGRKVQTRVTHVVQKRLNRDSPLFVVCL